MEELPASEAKSLGANVRYVPFGIPGLDQYVPGIPTGSAVLLAGAPDAGGRAFLYTSLATQMLAKYRPEMAPRSLDADPDAIPERVTYVSLSHDREHIYGELDAVLDTYQFETLTDHLTVADFSQQFLDAAPVPDPLYGERRSDAPIQGDELGSERGDAEALLDDVAARLAEVGDESIVVVDDIADLVRANHFGLEQSDVLGFLLGIREAAVAWDGLAYLVYQRRAAEVRSDVDVHGLPHGSVFFYSNDHGYETLRTMRVGSFGGALDSDQQRVFEGLVGPTGYRAKATKKIGPSNW